MRLNADKFQTFGQTEILYCPECKQPVNMTLLKSSSALGVMGIPVLQYKVELFSLCPACGTVFAVSEDAAKRVGGNNTNKANTISEAHLSKVTKLNLQ